MTNENKHKQTTQMECSHMAGSGTVYDKHRRHGVGTPSCPIRKRKPAIIRK